MSDQYSAQLPNRDAPAVDPKSGMLETAWYNFMAFMSSLTATALESVSVGSSPYTFEASKIGHLHVAAGTVSSVVLQRGGVTLSCPTSGFVPVVAGDAVAVTYTAAPTLTFIPGART